MLFKIKKIIIKKEKKKKKGQILSLSNSLILLYLFRTIFQQHPRRQCNETKATDLW